MADPNLNPASQKWGRAVTASVAKVDVALTSAHRSAKTADGNLQTSITRAAGLAVAAQEISDYLLTLTVVESASRTNAIGV